LNSHRITLGISFLAFGILALLSGAGYVFLTIEKIIGISFVVYSIPTVYISLNTGERQKLVFATILFLVGVVFFIKSQYEIFDTRGIVFSSILFISGSVLLILFIENTKEKIFLIAAIVLILLSYAAATLFKGVGLFTTTNRLGTLLEIFWPLILILFGISIFARRKKL